MARKIRKSIRYNDKEMRVVRSLAEKAGKEESEFIRDRSMMTGES